MPHVRVGCALSCLLVSLGVPRTSPLSHVTDAELVDALFSNNPQLTCLPFLVGVEVSPHDPLQIQTRTGYGAADLPTNGTDFILMATGDPDAPAEDLDVDFGVAGCIDDNAQITFTFDFPDVGGGISAVQSIKFDFDLISYEFPEFVGQGFNDYVYAFLDAAPPAVPIGAACAANVPPPTGCLLTFDASGNPTNIDNAFLQTCDTVGCDNPSGTPGWDSVFTTVPGDDAGRTGTLVTCSPSQCTVPVTPGVHTLTLMVGDAGDGLYTTVGMFDNLRCFGDLECDAAVTEPEVDVCATRLFGAGHSGGSSTPSTLYEIDPATGGATPIGPIGFNTVGGMDFDPLTGALYAVGKRLSDGVYVLLTIDPLTGNGAEVGPLVNTVGGGGGHFDLSFRNADGGLFLTALSPAGCISLFRIELATGLATEVGSTTTCAPGNAIGFDWGDMLYHTDNTIPLGGSGTQHVLDQALGVATPLNALTYLGFPALSNPRTNAMDFDPATGTGYVGVNDGNGGMGPNYLARIDPATGEVQHIGPTLSGLDTIAWKSECDDEDPCTYDVCEHCEPEVPPTAPFHVLAVDCDPEADDAAGLFSGQEGPGRALARADRGDEFLIREVSPTEFRELTEADLADFDVIALSSDPRRSGDDCLSGGAGLGSAWHAAVGVEGGGRVTVLSGETRAIGGLTRPTDVPPFTHVTSFGTDEQLRLAALWAAAGNRTGLLILEHETRQDGGLGFDQFELSLPAAWDLTELATRPAADGSSARRILPGFAQHLLADGSGSVLAREALAAGCTPGDCELFGAAHTGADAPSSLYSIDSATGEATLIGPIGFGGVSGLDFAADGTLYGTGFDGGSVHVLITIDTTTGAGTAVGPTGIIQASDISFRNADGQLFGYQRPGGSLLYEISTVTGAGTALGSSGVADCCGHGISFDSPDTLWHAGDLNANTLDQATGAATPMASLTFVGFPAQTTLFRVNAMDTAPCSGVIYVSVPDGSNGAGPNYLATLDPLSGVVNFIGQTVLGLDAVAWRQNPTLGVCTHTLAPDSDGDGLCDALDSCNGFSNPDNDPAPFGQVVLALDATTFGWSSAVPYTWVRGEFTQSSDIRPYAHDATGTAFDSTLVDATQPTAGGGLWYLLRPNCTAGSWSSDGPSECGVGVGTPGCIPGERDGTLP